MSCKRKIEIINKKEQIFLKKNILLNKQKEKNQLNFQKILVLQCKKGSHSSLKRTV